MISGSSVGPSAPQFHERLSEWPSLVVLAVRLVVLVVVGDEIVEREAVVRGDEIDARPRLAAAEVELVGRGAEARRERPGARLAAPEVAHRVAKRIVPLGPAGREAADLIAARAAVPRLGDQLHFREQRVLADRLEEAALGFEAVGLAREDRAEVEAEAVDLHLAHPVAQAVGHHLDDARMAEIERVSGAGVVDVVALLVGHAAGSRSALSMPLNDSVGPRSLPSAVWL